jgi:hypothetical protein
MNLLCLSETFTTWDELPKILASDANLLPYMPAYSRPRVADHSAVHRYLPLPGSRDLARGIQPVRTAISLQVGREFNGRESAAVPES